ncbi:HK97 gp10 family phage protein [Silvimonas terrae]|uniref:HK97 gp10 family phage protein n=1 Tax=Silvimonas terrae TaxID=300266 RepID=A0A840RAH7_9NEIS|nr:HK97-gp10 family putative phage morphogenesis protein [Silvimonas terrae]MBB5189604.1 HK97 gp10 family phage protein [Silvimonas terrae]
MKQLSSLGELAEVFTKNTLGMMVTMQAGLEKAAVVVEKDAKQRIGEYQEAEGPFPAWAELSDSTKEDRARQGYTENDPLLRSGDLQRSIEHEVGYTEAVIGSKSPVAAYQEFGTYRIPPRPFLGPAAFHNKKRIQRILGAAMVSGLVGGSPVHALLGYDGDV